MNSKSIVKWYDPINNKGNVIITAIVEVNEKSSLWKDN